MWWKMKRVDGFGEGKQTSGDECSFTKYSSFIRAACFISDYNKFPHGQSAGDTKVCSGSWFAEEQRWQEGGEVLRNNNFPIPTERSHWESGFRELGLALFCRVFSQWLSTFIGHTHPNSPTRAWGGRVFGTIKLLGQFPVVIALVFQRVWKIWVDIFHCSNKYCAAMWKLY